MMQLSLPLVRIVLYCALAFLSFILFALTAARIQYTTHIPKGDPLNGGVNFHDPIAVELLITTLMTMPWSLFAAYTIHYRYENRYVSLFKAEAAALSVLWLFWVVGAAIASNMWGNLSWCQQFEACRVLSALVAFAWLGWLSLSVLLVLCLLFCFANTAFNEPFHGRWNPRETRYVDPVQRL